MAVVIEKCEFTFGTDGPRCQKPKRHDGQHIWNSGVAMREGGLKPQSDLYSREEFERDRFGTAGPHK